MSKLEDAKVKKHIRKKSDLDDELCEHCNLKDMGITSSPGGMVIGCEGSQCDEAYENYIDSINELNNEQED